MSRVPNPNPRTVEFGLIGGRPAVRGDCDIVNAARIERWLARRGAAAIEIDLSGVTFLDSAGLLVFLRAVRRNPDLRVVDPSAPVRRVLELTDTVDYLVHGRDLFE